MAEPTGLVFGAIGLVGLVGAITQGLRAVELALDYDEDVKDLALQFDNQRQIFLNWAADTGLDGSRKVDPHLSKKSRGAENIKKTCVRIHEHLPAGCVLTEEHGEVEEGEKKRVWRWVVHDHDAFQKLVKALRRYNKDLRDLSVAPPTKIASPTQSINSKSNAGVLVSTHAASDGEGDSEEDDGVDDEEQETIDMSSLEPRFTRARDVHNIVRTESSKQQKRRKRDKAKDFAARAGEASLEAGVVAVEVGAMATIVTGIVAVEVVKLPFTLAFMAIGVVL